MLELRRQLQEVYELRTTIIGSDDTDEKESVYHGRTIRWRDWSIELEGSEKYVSELLKCIGMETCRLENTPMTAVDYKEDDRNKTEQQMKPLLNSDARLYRRGTVVAVYISHDRPDFNAASCQLATRTREPTEYDWERSKRLGRYAQG